MGIYRYHRHCKEQKGFSYLWVLMVVAMLGGFMAMTADVYQTFLQRERERELIFIGAEFREAIRRYYENAPVGVSRSYPQSLDQLLLDSRHNKARRYLRKIYIDPMTGKLDWGLFLVAGRIAGVYSLSSASPLKKDGFAFSESSFKGKERYSDWVFTYPVDLVITSDVINLQ